MKGLPSRSQRSARAEGAPEPGLPDGVLWRRAATQIATRIGLFPGDRVVLLAPRERDVGALLAARLPRLRFVQIEGGVFGVDPAVGGASPPRLAADPAALPLAEGCVEAFVVLFATPLVDGPVREALVDAATRSLYPFGKWLELVAVEGPRDPRLAAAERRLKDAGFEKVRSLRLALGRLGVALFLVTARWPGAPMDDDEEE